MPLDTHSNPDPQRDNLTPDISVYADGDVPDTDAKTDFSKMKLFIELKCVETSNPFRDPKDPLQPPAENLCFENVSDVSLCTFSDVTHISTIANADTTLPSHQHCRRISSISSMLKNVCEMRILPIVNSV
jgi:hypothetical protein